MNIYHARLLMLADKLDEVSHAEFNMGVYATDSEGLPLEPLEVHPHDCGTVACALGWSLNVLELYLVAQEHQVEISGYGKGWQALSKVLFDISRMYDRELWNFLFDAHWKKAAPTAHDAALRIRYYVKHNGIPPCFGWESNRWLDVMNQVREDMA